MSPRFLFQVESEGILHRSRGGLHRLSQSGETESSSATDRNSHELKMGVSLGPEVADGIPESHVEKAVEAETANDIVDERAQEAEAFGDDDAEADEDADDMAAEEAVVAKDTQKDPSTPDGLFFHDGFLSFASRECLVFPLQFLVYYASKTKKLDLSFNRLVNVKGLEKFVDLEELILDNNELTDDINFPNLAKLVTLSVNKNRIVDLDRFASMCRWKFPALTFLSLVGNDCCPNLTSLANTGDEDEEEEHQRYRYTVLSKMPTLKFLDFTPVSGEKC